MIETELRFNRMSILVKSSAVSLKRFFERSVVNALETVLHFLEINKKKG